MAGGPEQTGTIDTTGRTQQQSNAQTRARTSGETRSFAAQEAAIPDFLRSLIMQGTGVAGTALSRLQDLSGGPLVAPFVGDQLSAFEAARGFGAGAPFQSALNAFLPTARGDFLFGGPGFQEAVDASVRAAQPHILSTFGAAGRGTGGLARAAIAQQATDAFASQFGQERGRQLQAASALPGLGLMPIDLLLRTGGIQQAQRQQEISALEEAQQSLLASAFGLVPISNLLGFTQSGSGTTRGTTRGTISDSLMGTSLNRQPFFENPTGSALGGGLSGAVAGAQLGSMLFPGIGTAVGALGGGLLGAFL